MENELGVADRLRGEYDDCTRQLEIQWRSIMFKCSRLEWMLRIFSDWYANDLHKEHIDDIGALTTERGIAAFNAALAEVLPALPLRNLHTKEKTSE